MNLWASAINRIPGPNWHRDPTRMGPPTPRYAPGPKYVDSPNEEADARAFGRARALDPRVLAQRDAVTEPNAPCAESVDVTAVTDEYGPSGVKLRRLNQTNGLADEEQGPVHLCKPPAHYRSTDRRTKSLLGSALQSSARHSLLRARP